jgi:two-component system alkaline phosphatase synthesis response regulator PhoP
MEAWVHQAKEIESCRDGIKSLTRNQLLDDIQNDDAFIVDRNIDVHVASLRKKLGPSFHWIETVRGVGYRFKEED